jgi:hypothetical protein
MKAITVNPGRVYQPVQAKGKWTYSIEYVYPSGAQMVGAGITFVTSNEAMSAMRFEVNRLRLKYR